MPKPKSGAFSRFCVSLIEQRLEDLHLSIHAAEKRYGFPPETLRSVIRGSSPSVDRFKQICDALEIEFSLGGGLEGGGLRGGELPSSEKSEGLEAREGGELPIVGVMGEDSVISCIGEPFSKEGRVSVPQFLSKQGQLAGILVRGGGMQPIFEEGDILFFDVSVCPDIEEALGKICIIECADGSGLVKRVERGRQSGRYNLESSHWQHPVLVDVSLRTARPVLWIKKA